MRERENGERGELIKAAVAYWYKEQDRRVTYNEQDGRVISMCRLASEQAHALHCTALGACNRPQTAISVAVDTGGVQGHEALQSRDM